MKTAIPIRQKSSGKKGGRQSQKKLRRTHAGECLANEAQTGKPNSQQAGENASRKAANLQSEIGATVGARGGSMIFRDENNGRKLFSVELSPEQYATLEKIRARCGGWQEDFQPGDVIRGQPGRAGNQMQPYAIVSSGSVQEHVAFFKHLVTGDRLEHELHLFADMGRFIDTEVGRGLVGRITVPLSEALAALCEIKDQLCQELERAGHDADGRDRSEDVASLELAGRPTAERARTSGLPEPLPPLRRPGDFPKIAWDASVRRSCGSESLLHTLQRWQCNRIRLYEAHGVLFNEMLCWYETLRFHPEFRAVAGAMARFLEADWELEAALSVEEEPRKKTKAA